MNQAFDRSRPSTSAVLFLVFNRPEPTARVFEAIRRAKPKKLYVASDGPRSSRPDEAKKVMEARHIATAVDWDCEVITLFRDGNLGCKRAVSGAISWFFEQEEEGIILEDDCLPAPDFFGYCDSLLVKYRHDPRIFAITGDNFQNGIWRGDGSYYFSRYVHVWGWATWKRAWNRYDGEISFWPQWKVSDDWKAKIPDGVERHYWEKIFDRIYANEIDTWDYQWTASAWRDGGLIATPNVNMVSNIGFGSDSTHTSSKDSPFADMAVAGFDEIIHPSEVIPDRLADRYNFDYTFGGIKLRFPRALKYLPVRVARFLIRKMRRSIA
jgi:hypothetical protein